jgi:hypothetical protein
VNEGFPLDPKGSAGMSDIHITVEVDGRAGGRSCAGSAAYRSGGKIKCVITQKVFDYSARKGVEDTFILGPRSDEDEEEELWWEERERLWAEVELAEARKDAQLYREVTVSLPHELTVEQRRALMVDFVQEQFVSLGMVADVAIHSTDARGAEAQPHAHVMLTLRRVEGDGFAAKKERAWNDRALVGQWRQAWAETANRALVAAGYEARLDHRSILEQRDELLVRAADEQDEVKRLRLEAQAVALDYIPQPRLDAPVWRAMKAGTDDPAFLVQIAAFEAAKASKVDAQARAAALEGQARVLEAQRAQEKALEALRAQQAALEVQRLLGRAAEARRAAEKEAQRAKWEKQAEERLMAAEAQDAAQRLSWVQHGGASPVWPSLRAAFEAVISPEGWGGRLWSVLQDWGLVRERITQADVSDDMARGAALESAMMFFAVKSTPRRLQILDEMGLPHTLDLEVAAHSRISDGYKSAPLPEEPKSQRPIPAPAQQQTPEPEPKPAPVEPEPEKPAPRPPSSFGRGM